MKSSHRPISDTMVYMQYKKRNKNNFINIEKAGLRFEERICSSKYIFNQVSQIVFLLCEHSRIYTSLYKRKICAYGLKKKHKNNNKKNYCTFSSYVIITIS